MKPDTLRSISHSTRNLDSTELSSRVDAESPAAHSTRVWRYLDPDARWVRWSSRAAKAATIVIVIGARG